MTATIETCPFHIWKHNVICAARVAVTDLGDDLNAKLKLWYRTGEPVEMAASSLAFVVSERAKEDRAENEVRALRGRLANARKAAM